MERSSTHITCLDADVPTAARLCELVDEDRYVVLGPPEGASFSDAGRIRQELQAALPEWIHVFDPGGGRITVMGMLRRETVLAGADAIVEAAGNFGLLGTALGRRLAAKLDLMPEHLGQATLRFSLSREQQSGQVNRLWTWSFHGYEVLFRSSRGLVLDCRLGYGEDLGALDPWFLANFVSGRCDPADTVGLVRSELDLAGRLVRAPEVHRRAHHLLRGDFHRAARALDVLEQVGRLVRRPATAPDLGPGLFAPY